MISENTRMVFKIKRQYLNKMLQYCEKSNEERKRNGFIGFKSNSAVKEFVRRKVSRYFLAIKKES